ncbi:hypothetical protein RLO149_c008960 [Roseobacter litoralis Och 149]|uniref:Uncharacterized protein n=1 Tax=Roseobacter litoralis (strain ATCC 49566 / DSM 6996 / JCM 21268 / NBRC 15278 / OCh 149) TaxID=391595 RepID=F7Z9W0_ROSLO|nr:hypothetical protein RLO149_c008960 [Roseobacter litoralis Och 149]
MSHKVFHRFRHAACRCKKKTVLGTWILIGIYVQITIGMGYWYALHEASFELAIAQRCVDSWPTPRRQKPAH